MNRPFPIQNLTIAETDLRDGRKPFRSRPLIHTEIPVSSPSGGAVPPSTPRAPQATSGNITTETSKEPVAASTEIREPQRRCAGCQQLFTVTDYGMTICPPCIERHTGAAKPRTEVA